MEEKSCKDRPRRDFVIESVSPLARAPTDFLINSISSSPPSCVSFRGRSLIPPSSTFARAVVMGNEHSSLNDKDSQNHSVLDQQSSVSDKNPQHNFVPSRPASNLTMLLNQHEQQQNNHIQTAASNSTTSPADEADSASGPPNSPGALNPNAPEEATGPLSSSNGSYIAAGSAPANALFIRESSSGAAVIGSNPSRQSDRVRR